MLTWKRPCRFDVSHDRAEFHCLTEAADQEAYLRLIDRALRPGGHAIIGTFALFGPTSCSGLPVVRCDAALLSRRLDDGYRLVRPVNHEYRTPWGTGQRFHFGLLQKA